MSASAWAITRFAAGSVDSRAFFIDEDGVVNSSPLKSDFQRYAAVRPIFNLIDGITYESGTGTQSDPIRIA